MLYTHDFVFYDELFSPFHPSLLDPHLQIYMLICKVLCSGTNNINPSHFSTSHFTHVLSSTLPNTASLICFSPARISSPHSLQKCIFEPVTIMRFFLPSLFKTVPALKFVCILGVLIPSRKICFAVAVFILNLARFLKRRLRWPFCICCIHTHYICDFSVCFLLIA